jgi:predicted RNase H-like HicB family nuclease
MTKYTVVYTEEAEGGFSGRSLELPGAISQGETLEELERNMTDAVQLILASIYRFPIPLLRRKKKKEDYCWFAFRVLSRLDSIFNASATRSAIGRRSIQIQAPNYGTLIPNCSTVSTSPALSTIPTSSTIYAISARPSIRGTAIYGRAPSYGTAICKCSTVSTSPAMSTIPTSSTIYAISARPSIRGTTIRSQAPD